MSTYVHWSLSATQAALKFWNSKFCVKLWRLWIVAAEARLTRAVMATINFILGGV